MTKYNEAQVDFRDKSKGRIARQLEISELRLLLLSVIHIDKSEKWRWIDSAEHNKELFW